MLKVGYSLGDETGPQHVDNATLSIRTLSNNVLAEKIISDMKGEIQLQSDCIKPGVYVVTLSSSLGEVVTNKVLIK